MISFARLSMPRQTTSGTPIDDWFETQRTHVFFEPRVAGRSCLASALVAAAWRAYSVAGVVRVVAHANATNVASIKVLERCGFTPAGAGRELDTVRHERLRTTT